MAVRYTLCAQRHPRTAEGGAGRAGQLVDGGGVTEEMAAYRWGLARIAGEGLPVDEHQERVKE
jgi:hypothetical protein